MVSLSELRVRAARAAIAAAVLDTLPDETLGDIRLGASQRLSIARATRDVRRFGGCLIGEEVGRGKTYIALGIAREWNRPLVVAPASLRSTWLAAMQRAAVPCAFASHDGLSAGRLPDSPFDGVIVDESHHFRTTTTQRFAALTKLAANVPIVLLSATPLQNRPRDLAAQLALFLGERAFSLEIAELSRFVLRSDATMNDMPAVAEPEWLSVHVDDTRVLAAILALAPPARPCNGGDAGVLRTISFVRAWTSSRAALVATLRKRRRMATAIEQSAEAGRQPTRREARAWHAVDDAIQLGFSTMLVDKESEPASLGALTAAARDDLEATHDLLSLLRCSADPDIARVAAIRQLRSRFSGSRILAFSERASTIAALFAGMRGDAGVGMLTAREARIASGPLARDELIDRFAPVSRGRRPLCRREEVTLLLATDLLSEGVNLQDADVVLHLDLPWNPARLAQRVGRLRRPGGAATVRSFLLAPPASAAAVLDAERRLRHKLGAADMIVGGSFRVMPASGATPDADVPRNSADVAGAILERISAWRRAQTHARPGIIAAVQSPDTGWLAALDDGRLVCMSAGHVTEATSSLRAAVISAAGSGRPMQPQAATHALNSLNEWLVNEHVMAVAGADDHLGALRKTVDRWLDGVVRTVPRHQRASALPNVATVREALRGPLSLGTERGLAALVANSVGANATLSGLLALIDASGRGTTRAADRDAVPSVVAIILLLDDGGSESP